LGDVLFLVVAAVLEMITAVAAAAAACATAIFFDVIVTRLSRWEYGSKGSLTLWRSDWEQRVVTMLLMRLLHDT
jgi:hypothetical protein